MISCPQCGASACPQCGEPDPYQSRLDHDYKGHMFMEGMKAGQRAPAGTPPPDTVGWDRTEALFFTAGWRGAQDAKRKDQEDALKRSPPKPEENSPINPILFLIGLGLALFFVFSVLL